MQPRWVLLASLASPSERSQGIARGRAWGPTSFPSSISAATAPTPCRSQSRPRPTAPCGYTESGANKIGRVTTDGAFSEYALPTAGAIPQGIARNRDGSLWFVEAGADRIGRIAPSNW